MARKCREQLRLMLTFGSLAHNAPINRGSRRSDSADFCFLDTEIFREYRHEAHLSAKQPRSRASPWFSSSYGDRSRPQHIERTPRPRTQKAVCLSESNKTEADKCRLIP
jgi:hypothetical protein